MTPNYLSCAEHDGITRLDDDVVSGSSPVKFVETEEKGSVSSSMDRKSHKIVIIALTLLSVVAGSANTLAIKWTDSIIVDGKGMHFAHPIFKANTTFVGEILCMPIFFITLYVRRYRWRRLNNTNRNATFNAGLYKSRCSTATLEPAAVPRFNYFLFALPAFCDVISTSLSYHGLAFTSASSFQMLRGAVIIFTGLLSATFFKAKLQLFKWIGMAFLSFGLAIVGIADVILGESDLHTKNKDNIIVGDSIIVIAQIIVAIQMVIEQKLLADTDVPILFAVGLEGIFGFLIVSVLLIPVYFIHLPPSLSDLPEHRLEDFVDALHSMTINRELMTSLIIATLSIAVFNSCGLAFTKFMSATSRMVIGTMRTFAVWMVSFMLFSTNFALFQGIGFLSAIFGMLVYNDLLIMPFFRKTKFYLRIYNNEFS